jgi:hypothetical protein
MPEPLAAVLPGEPGGGPGVQPWTTPVLWVLSRRGRLRFTDLRRLGDTLLAALRRLAEEDTSARHPGGAGQRGLRERNH